MNNKPGATWLSLFKSTFDKIAWLNPTPEEYWHHTRSTEIIKDLVNDKMYPLTLKGMEQAMNYLSK